MLQHALDENDCASDVVFIVLHGLAYTLSDSLESSKVDDREERTMGGEYSLHATLVAKIYFLKDDHIINFAGNLLHAFKSHSVAVDKVVDDHDLREPTVAFRLKNFNNCVGANIAYSSSDKQHLGCLRRVTFYHFFNL